LRKCGKTRKREKKKKKWKRECAKKRSDLAAIKGGCDNAWKKDQSKQLGSVVKTERKERTPDYSSRKGGGRKRRLRGKRGEPSPDPARIRWEGGKRQSAEARIKETLRKKKKKGGDGKSMLLQKKKKVDELSTGRRKKARQQLQ